MAFLDASRFLLGTSPVLSGFFCRPVCQRNPRIPDVPTLYELMDQNKIPEAKKRLAPVYLGAGGFGSRPIVATPGISTERAQILREAYAKTLKDSEFLEEAKKKRWPEIQFSGGVELELWQERLSISLPR